ncbi:MAG: hypothetical protein QW514_01020 [Thermoprotei archaeon]
MVFPIGAVEFAFKRSRLPFGSTFERSIQLMRLVGHVLGGCRVNFDAETPNERLSGAALEELCSSGFMFSETYQVCQPDGNEYLDILLKNYRSHKVFGLNLVMGNPHYGVRPRLNTLLEMMLSLAKQGDEKRIKVGVEGPHNGLRIIRECARLGHTAYILNTPQASQLIKECNVLGVQASVYTPVRLSKCSRQALHETLGLMADYLKRRGLSNHTPTQPAHEYVVFGSPTDVKTRLKTWFELGVKSVVLSPVYTTLEDLEQQLRYISQLVEK